VALWHTIRMRHYKTCFVLLLAAGVSTAFAADPPAPVPTATAADAGDSASAAGATAATPTAAVSATTAAAATADTPRVVDRDAQAKRLRGQGYKPLTRNGEIVWCRKEATLGSRFTTPVCMSADDIDKASANGKDLVDTIQRQNYTTPKGN
jgi:hypothetical protein